MALGRLGKALAAIALFSAGCAGGELGRQTWESGAVLRGQRGIIDAAFIRGGEAALTRGSDNKLRLWSAATGERLWERDATGPFAVSPDGRSLAMARGSEVDVSDLDGGQARLTLKGHPSRVWLIAFSEKGDRVLTSDVDQTTRLWDAATGGCLRTFPGMKSVFFRGCERILTFCDNRTAAYVWEADSGRAVLSVQEASHFGAVSPDGELVALPCDDGSVRVFKVADGSVLATLDGVLERPFEMEFTRDGSRLVTSGVRPSDFGRPRSAVDRFGVAVWDALTGKLALSLGGFQEARAVEVAGQAVLLCEGKGSLAALDASTGAEIQSFPGESGLLAISDDARLLLTSPAPGAAEARGARIWRLKASGGR
jgi:WD40 repeat protein